MLSIFRTNQFFANILLLFYAIVVHLSAFVIPHRAEMHGIGLLSDWVYTYLSVPGFWSNVFAVLLVTVQGTLINYLVTRYRMASDVTLFPGLFYILITALLPDFLVLSPPLMANTFLIVALFQVMETYKKYACIDDVYNVGFWLGIASLFYFSYSVFMVMAWAGLNILRAFKVNERIALVFGFLTPFVLLFTYYYWMDERYLFWQKAVTNHIAFLDFRPADSIAMYVGLGVMGVLLAVSIFSMRSYNLKKNIRVQKNISILYITLFLAAVTFVFQAGTTLTHLIVLAVPLGIFISFNFSDMSRKSADALHLIWLVTLLAWHFIPLLNF